MLVELQLNHLRMISFLIHFRCTVHLPLKSLCQCAVSTLKVYLLLMRLNSSEWIRMQTRLSLLVEEERS